MTGLRDKEKRTGKRSVQRRQRKGTMLKEEENTQFSSRNQNCTLFKKTGRRKEKDIL